MAVKYAYASISENGTVNGKAGDSTGKEVKKANEYNFGQVKVIRCTNKAMRKRIGDASIAIADNDNFGYSQDSRGGVYTQVSKVGWDVSKIKDIKVKCNTDCSNMAGVCINCGYGKKVIPSDVTSRNIITYVDKFTGKDFQVLNYKKGMTLYKGDILQKAGHCVIVYKGGTAKV